MNSPSKAPAAGCRRVLCRTGLPVAVVACACLLFNTLALAGPKGGKVTGGKGSIARAGTTTNVQQLTERMSVEWQSFDLGRTDSVNFLQPGSSSLVLNHILQNGPSQIDGRINANGHVLLINPRGVIFGENSIINVGALTASTLWMNKDDFLNGDMMLRALDDSKGVVVNSGLISAASGGVTLLGEGVSNEGLITAELGYVNLVSGREAYLTFDEEGFLGVKVTEDVVENLLGEDSNVENSGEISATGGKVIMSANVSRGLFDSAVNNSGIIAATGFDDVPGGTVHLLGDTVAVAEGARISVDGKSGGGEILVGGDYQGANPDIDNAQFTRVAKDTVLSANALESGDGGKVIVWADDIAEFHGNILANGGSRGGNGGFAEVSGKQQVWVTGSANLRASNGRTGLLLIDPAGTVTIENGDDAPEMGTFTDGWINTQIADANVTITTESDGDPNAVDEDIVFMPVGESDTIEIELDGGNTLTLDAGRHITLTSSTNVSLKDETSTGNLNLKIGQDGNGGELDLADASITANRVLITGGSGPDTIVGADSYEVVDIDPADDVTTANTGMGTLNGSSFDFIGVENLTGNDGMNTFTLTSGSIGVLSGLGGNDTFDIVDATFAMINGGSHDVGEPPGMDTVNYANAVTLDVDTLMEIELVNANSDGVDTLTGAELYTIAANGVTSDNTLYTGFTVLAGSDDDGASNTIEGATNYEVTGANAGEAELITDAMAGTADTYAFTLIHNLTGHNGENTFELTAGSVDDPASIGAMVGLGGDDTFDIYRNSFDEIDGDGGLDTTGTDTVNYEIAVDLDLTDSSLMNIEEVNANAAGSTLSGASGDNAYLFTSNTRVLVNGSNSPEYDGFEILEGSGLGDTFDLAGFTFTGELRGLGGDDTFDLGDGGEVIGSIIGSAEDGAIDADEIVGADNYKVISDFEGIVNDDDSMTFSKIENLTGNDGMNTFTLTSGSIGVLSGLGGNDTFDIVDATFAMINGGSHDVGEPPGMDTVNYANAVTLDVDTLMEIELVNANSDGVDTLTGAELYTIAADGVTSGNTLYTGFTVLAGSDDDGASNTIEGATNYEVTGANAGEAELITDAMAGTADTYAFTLIHNLTGHNGENTFELTAGSVDDPASIGAMVGLGGDDTFDIYRNSFDEIDGDGGLDTTGTDTVNYEIAVDLDLTDSSLMNIEEVNANAAGSTLSGASGDNAYLFTSNTRVLVNGSNSPEYDGFEILEGSGLGDTFDLAGFTFTGELRGLGGDDTFDLGDGGEVIGSIIGSAEDGAIDADEIVGADNYKVISDFEGIVNDDDSMTFSKIENLTGNDGMNTFTLTSGSIGVLSGLGGNDTFDIVDATFAMINGGSHDVGEPPGMDTVNYANAVTLDVDTLMEIELVNANSDGVDTLTGAELYTIAANGVTSDNTLYTGFTVLAGSDDDGASNTIEGATNYEVTGANAGEAELITDAMAGTADTYAFTLIHNLTGHNGENTFELTAGSVDDPASIGAMVGLGGDDTFDIYRNSFDEIDGDGGLDTTGTDTVNYEIAVDLDLTDSSLMNIEEVNANAAGSTLSGASGDNAYLFTSNTRVLVNGSNSPEYDGFEILEGSGLGDTFDLAGFTFTGELRGLGGDDTFDLGDGGEVIGSIIGSAEDGAIDADEIVGADNYKVTSDFEGIVNDEDSMTFSKTENLTGNDGMNTFTLTSGSIGVLSGLGGNDTFDIVDATFAMINGGSHDVGEPPGMDTVNYANAVTLDVDTLMEIELVNANSDGVDTLTGAELYTIAADGVTSGNTLYTGFTVLAGSDDDGASNTVKGATNYEVTGANAGTAELITDPVAGTGDTYAFTLIHNLTGNDQANTFTLTTGSIGVLSGLGADDTFDLSTFNTPAGMTSVGEIVGGEGLGDTMKNDGSGIQLNNEGGFLPVSGVVGLVSQVEVVTNTVDLFGTGGSETFLFIDDPVYMKGVQVMPPESGISFFDVKNLNGGGGDDGIDANNNGVKLLGKKFKIAGFDILIEGVSTVSRVDVLTGDDGENETYSLNGTTATVDTQNNGNTSTSFLGVTNLLGGGGSDTLNNNGRGVTLLPPGFVTGGGVTVSQIEEVTSTGNLTGSAASEIFTLTGGDVSVVPPGASISFSGVENLDGGPGLDTLIGSSEYVLESENGGSAGTRRFSSMENLQGTTGNDTFTKAGGSLSGTIDGLEQQGGEGDRLVGFSTYALSENGPSTADGTAFENIESLTGTAEGDDLLEGVNVAVLTEADGGTANDYFFHDIENLAGTAGNDSFTRAGGSLSGSINGREGGDDILVGFNSYVLTGLNRGTANGADFSGIENLRGTAGNDTFRKANSSGLLEGLIQGEGEDPNSDGDELLDFVNYSILGVGSGIADGTEYEGIESISATGSGSLQGSDGPNTFILDGPDSGTVDDIAFSGFANLEGLGGDDVFQRKDDGALSGTIDGGDDDDRIEGFTAYLLSGPNSGTADDTNFLNVENLWGTRGNDSFTNDGGSLTGIINGLEQAGGPVDQLIGFSRYDLGTGGLPTADDIRFENIESLVGTPGDGDRLVGGSAYEVTGRNSGNVNGSFSFSEIEHLEGTSGDDTFDIINGSIVTLDGLAGDDRFVLEGGVVTGTVIGGEGIDEIVGANLYALTEDNKGVASLVDANGNTTSSAPFETVESLVGTSGSDTFNLGGYTLSGTIDGLGDSTTDGPGLVIDRVIFVQDQESQGNIGILVTEDGDPATDGNGYIGFGLSSDEFENAGTDAFQLRYVGIEDFLLMLERDLNIKGIGTISSSADIEVKGSLNMYGPASSDPALTLDAGQNITIQQNLLAKGKSIIDVSTTGTVLTIGGSVSIDTASGAEINGLVSVTITEEPVIQIEVEETTSLSIFGKVDIFPAGRNSVARQSDENELSSEDEFIEALRAAEPVY